MTDDCPACERQAGEVLGQLGGQAQLRCRCCGWWWSVPADQIEASADNDDEEND